MPTSRKKEMRELLAEDSLSSLTRSDRSIHAELLYSMSRMCSSGALMEFVNHHEPTADVLIGYAESCFLAARATGTHMQGAEFI